MIEAKAGPARIAVGAGEVHALRGPNGSGKTTLLRRLAGLAPPQGAGGPADGVALVDGQDPAGWHAAELARHVAFAPDDPHAGLVGLTVAGEFRLRGRAAPPELAALARRDVAGLSSGEARRVLLATLREAPNVLLDEPAEALDGAARAALASFVAQRAAQGAAVLAADHRGAVAARAATDLGPAAAVDLPPAPHLPPPDDADARLAWPGGVAQRAPGRHVGLPAGRWGTGLHAVTGPNGSGKSTLLRALAGILAGTRPPAGGARLLVAPAHAHLREAMVAQELAGAAPDAAELAAGLADRHPLLLSAGEAQRVALAKVLGAPAGAYLLDEPEAHLDAAGVAALLAVLADRAKAAAVVVATHDPRVVAACRTRLELGA